MKPCSFEARQEGFYRIKHRVTPFRLTRDFEGAVGMRSGDECPTNISNRHCAVTQVQVESCWNPLCLSGGQVLAAPYESMKVFGVPGCPALLVTLSCAPQIWGEEGDYHPLQTCQHRQSFALSSFVKYSRGRSLGFNKSSTISGPKGIGSAVSPSCPILPLIAYARVHWTLHPKGFLAVVSFWDTLDRLALMVRIFVPGPRTWPEWVSVPLLLTFNLGEPPCSEEGAGFYSGSCVVSGFVN